MEIAIGNACIDRVAVNCLPGWDRLSSLSDSGRDFCRVSRTDRNLCPTTNTLRLLWGQNYEAQTFVNQQAENIIIAGCLRQPHSLSVTIKAMAEVGESPAYLRALVTFIG